MQTVVLEVMKKKIIFVCHGNICRSPMAEWIFKRIAEEKGKREEFEISSAAVSYEEQGNDIYPPSKRVLTAHNIPFKKHSAHRISLDEILRADYVVVMDYSNKHLLSNLITQQATDHKQIETAESKVHLLMKWCSGEAGRGLLGDAGTRSHTVPEVADPWYTDNFEKAFADIYRGCQALLETLKNSI